ncbi:MAG: DUF975 family protein [Alistipes sp.]|nr:DUF975 family protein [Alistipes sp.]
MKNNVMIRQETRELMRGKWLKGAMIALIYMAVAALITYVTSGNPDENDPSKWLLSLATQLLASIVILYPLQVGFAMVWLKLARTGSGPELKPLLGGFTRRYHKSAMGTLLLMQIYTVLWTLLLIVPGIIKSIEYAMTPFIVADEPELGCNEAIEKSMAMMRGKRWQFFKIILGMIGWIILAVIPCVVLGVYVSEALAFPLLLVVICTLLLPYYQAVFAKFYLTVKEEEAK